MSAMLRDLRTQLLAHSKDSLDCVRTRFRTPDKVLAEVVVVWHAFRVVERHVRAATVARRRIVMCFSPGGLAFLAEEPVHEDLGGVGMRGILEYCDAAGGDVTATILEWLHVLANPLSLETHQLLVCWPDADRIAAGGYPFTGHANGLLKHGLLVHKQLAHPVWAFCLPETNDGGRALGRNGAVI